MAEYVNLNKCRSFNFTVGGALEPFVDQVCSEVIIVNRTGLPVNIKDNNYFDDANAFLLEDDESVTIRGVTNSNQVSAICPSGSGPIYYRTQFYSSNPSR